MDEGNGKSDATDGGNATLTPEERTTDQPQEEASTSATEVENTVRTEGEVIESTGTETEAERAEVEDELGEGEDITDTDKERENIQVTSFIDEDSVSRSSVNSKDSKTLQDEAEAKATDNDNSDQGETAKLVNEEDLSQDAGSIQSEVQMSIEGVPEANPEESNDSRQFSNLENENDREGDQDLMATDTLNDDPNLNEGEFGEDIVSEVDISAMMEVNFGEDDNDSSPNENPQSAEPEVIALDSDDDDDSVAKTVEDAEPVVNVGESVFKIDEHENVTEVDVNSMMEVQVEEDSRDSHSPSTSTVSRRPRRAAAEAAAKTIHKISSAEISEPVEAIRSRRKSQEDVEFDPDEVLELEPTLPPIKQHKCAQCKKTAVCNITIKQFGANVHLCSNFCFNRFRSQGADKKVHTLPCAKCGIMANDGNGVGPAYYWETMNFCSDLCVGQYQMDVGYKCCTCGGVVSWTSLGKYCVRFGSDIRQFCNPQCLDRYKKNARVCFNCQLDIRRIGNIILANIPSKNTPKEFCSNDCVEMYCDRNMHQPTRAKPQPEHSCKVCKTWGPVYKELVLSGGHFYTCSDSCWKTLLNDKGVMKASKCEMCAKFVHMDLGFTTPVYWLSSVSRIFGFCSHVCKNLYILNTRKILSCVSCKVKKYNFDLIEHFENADSKFAVCSLACIPRSKEYIKNIREVVYIPPPTSDKNTLEAQGELPVISAVSGSEQPTQPQRRSRRKMQHVLHEDPSAVAEAGAEIIQLDEDGGEYADVDITESENILDIFTLEELEDLLEFVRNREVRDVGLSAYPITRTIETQTDVSELNEMEKVPFIGDKCTKCKLNEEEEKKKREESQNISESETPTTDPEKVDKRSDSLEEKEADQSENDRNEIENMDVDPPPAPPENEEPEVSNANGDDEDKDSSASKSGEKGDSTDAAVTDKPMEVESAHNASEETLPENSDKEAAERESSTNEASKEQEEQVAERVSDLNENSLEPASQKEVPSAIVEPTPRRRPSVVEPAAAPTSQVVDSTAPTAVHSATVPLQSLINSAVAQAYAPSPGSPSSTSSNTAVPGMSSNHHSPMAASTSPGAYQGGQGSPSPNMVGLRVPPGIGIGPMLNYGARANVPVPPLPSAPLQYPPAYYPYNQSQSPNYSNVSPSIASSSSSSSSSVLGMSQSYTSHVQPPPLPPLPTIPPLGPIRPIASGYGHGHSSPHGVGHVGVGGGGAVPSASTPLGYLSAMSTPSPTTTQSQSVPPLVPSPPKNPRVEYALRTWKNMFGPTADPVYESSMQLSSKLCELINRGCKPNGERFRADLLLYISLGIQQILRDNKRADKIFYDHSYYSFVVIFTDYAERELAVGIHATIEENHFWESSELGASSPGVMLFSLVYLFYKHFGLKTWEMQASLNFCHIVVQSRYDQYGRFVKYLSLVGLPGAYKTEVPEDLSCPDRCLVKLYEFYCFKSEVRDGAFYKCLRHEYTPRTSWFTCQPLDQRHLYQMLVRASMIKVGTSSYS